jgi:hypothetical protein
MSTATELKDGIDQVREILVGAIQRELERKLARAESHLAARLAEIQNEARRRTEVIEAHLRKESDALSARMDGELNEIQEGLRSLTREHRDTKGALEQRVAKLEENFVRSQHDLRNQILEQAKSFLDELQKTREEFAEHLERELESLEVEPTEEPRSREPHEQVESRAV